MTRVIYYLADFCVVVHHKSGGNSTNSVAHKRVHNQKDLKSASVHHKSLEKNWVSKSILTGKAWMAVAVEVEQFDERGQETPSGVLQHHAGVPQ